jgi:hypothetical protein
VTAGVIKSLAFKIISLLTKSLGIYKSSFFNKYWKGRIFPPLNTLV